jgi:hypothetical protein
MACYTLPKATKGSQKWIQILINEKPDMLNRQIKTNLEMPEDETIDWLSPKVEDNYVEYDLKTFLKKLEKGVEELSVDRFWPKRGPQWDALGRSSSGKLFLVEAKSHIPELISTLRAKNPRSKAMIQKSLEDTQKDLGSKSDFDWSKTFYQYANRLAHVNFLRGFHMPAYLVCVYFVNDSEMKGPKTVEEWKGAIRLLHRCLGLRENLIQEWVIDIFADVTKI